MPMRLPARPGVPSTAHTLPVAAGADDTNPVVGPSGA